MSVWRWLSWFAVCIGLGIALGLVGLPDRAISAPAGWTDDERADRPRGSGLRDRDAALAEGGSPDPRFSARGDVRFGGTAASSPKAPPRIVIVIDDLGLSRAAFDRINALPGPLTLSFLPYGRDAQAMLDDVAPAHEAMLHLPMEPEVRVEDAGPDMLRVGNPASIRRALAVNMAKLSGFAGVNNHTGSKFTGDAASMRVLLEELDARGLYFLDSVTTARPVAREVAPRITARVIERDVFLDDDYDGGEEAVRRQLAELERIALAEGQAVGIGHPYKATARALGPWLVTAQARGFEIVPAGELAIETQPGLMAQLR